MLKERIGVDTGTFAIDEGWIGLLNKLFSLMSLCEEIEHPDAERIGELLNGIFDETETAFCRADRAGYLEWAKDMTIENDSTWYPCNAWYEEGQPDEAAYDWIDGLTRDDVPPD